MGIDSRQAAAEVLLAEIVKHAGRAEGRYVITIQAIAREDGASTDITYSYESAWTDTYTGTIPDEVTRGR